MLDGDRPAEGEGSEQQRAVAVAWESRDRMANGSPHAGCRGALQGCCGDCSKSKNRAEGDGAGVGNEHAKG